MRTLLPTLILAIALLPGCGGEAPQRPLAAGAAVAPQQATARSGDVTVRASAIQTSALGAEVARRYGIVRDQGTVLLLVTVRQGPDGRDVSLPARIEATVTDLRGRRKPLVLRELRSGDLLDYVGTLEVSLPDTLRFDVEVTAANGAAATLQLQREFFAR
jgi:hypothetical protein